MTTDVSIYFTDCNQSRVWVQGEDGKRVDVDLRSRFAEARDDNGELVKGAKAVEINLARAKRQVSARPA
jgi:hypothetical protein